MRSIILENPTSIEQELNITEVGVDRLDELFRKILELVWSGA